MAFPRKSGIEFLINTVTSVDQTHSSLAALPDGRFVATWIDDSQTGGDTSGRAIRAQILNADGGPASSEFVVNTATANAQAFPSITTLSDGRFVITWSDDSGSVDDTSGSAIRGQVYNMDGTRDGDEFLVNTITGNNQFTPSVSAVADGGFVIAWSDNSQSPDDISGSAVRAQIFNPDASFQGAEFLVNSATNGPQLGAAVAGLANGRFVITWSDSSTASGDSSGTAIRAQIYQANGSPVGSEFLVNSITGDRQYDPAITALDDGGFVVTWMDESEASIDLSGRAIRAQVYRADGTRSGVEFLVNTTTDNWQYDPAVTALDDGRFVVVWSDLSTSDDDTSGVAVRAQVYNNDGTRMGDEFLVNTTTTNWQFDASVTQLTDGRFAISWTDFSATGGDISGAAIRGQIFDPREAGVVLSGTVLDDDLVGTVFADELSGAKGDDTLFGGNGRDKIFGNAGQDSLHGGKHNDKIYGGFGQDEMTGGYGRDILFGGAKDDSLEGGYGDDTLFGGSGNDTLRGDEDNDHLRGQDGDDDLDGGKGDDTVIADAGDDVLKGGGRNDTLKGGTGKDRLLGGTGIDVLFGNEGADRLIGGAGGDKLKGGAGADRFIFVKATDSSPSVADRDTLLDFSRPQGDAIDLSRMDANTAIGDQAFDFIGSDVFSGAQGQVRAFQVGDNKTIIQGDIDGDGVKDFTIKLNGSFLLTETDFVL